MAPNVQPPKVPRGLMEPTNDGEFDKAYDDMCDQYKVLSGQLRAIADEEMKNARAAVTQNPDSEDVKNWYAFAVKQMSELNLDLNYYEVELDQLIRKDEIVDCYEGFEEILQHINNLYNPTTMSYRTGGGKTPKSLALTKIPIRRGSSVNLHMRTAAPADRTRPSPVAGPSGVSRTQSRSMVAVHSTSSLNTSTSRIPKATPSKTASSTQQTSAVPSRTTILTKTASVTVTQTQKTGPSKSTKPPVATQSKKKLTQAAAAPQAASSGTSVKTAGSKTLTQVPKGTMGSWDFRKWENVDLNGVDSPDEVDEQFETMSNAKKMEEILKSRIDRLCIAINENQKQPKTVAEAIQMVQSVKNAPSLDIDRIMNTLLAAAVFASKNNSWHLSMELILANNQFLGKSQAALKAQSPIKFGPLNQWYELYEELTNEISDINETLLQEYRRKTDRENDNICTQKMRAFEVQKTNNKARIIEAMSPDANTSDVATLVFAMIKELEKDTYCCNDVRDPLNRALEVRILSLPTHIANNLETLETAIAATTPQSKKPPPKTSKSTTHIKKPLPTARALNFASPSVTGTPRTTSKPSVVQATPSANRMVSSTNMINASRRYVSNPTPVPAARALAVPRRLDTSRTASPASTPKSTIPARKATSAYNELTASTRKTQREYEQLRKTVVNPTDLKGLLEKNAEDHKPKSGAPNLVEGTGKSEPLSALRHYQLLTGKSGAIPKQPGPKMTVPEKGQPGHNRSKLNNLNLDIAQNARNQSSGPTPNVKDPALMSAISWDNADEESLALSLQAEQMFASPTKQDEYVRGQNMLLKCDPHLVQQLKHTLVHVPSSVALGTSGMESDIELASTVAAAEALEESIRSNKMPVMRILANVSSSAAPDNVSETESVLAANVAAAQALEASIRSEQTPVVHHKE